MPRSLTTTSRLDLQDGSGVNTHFCFNPSVYAVGRTPNATLVDSIIGLGVSYVRERWWPHNAAQQAAFTTLADAGVGLYLFIGDMTYSPADARADVDLLASAPFAKSVVAVCGPNEPNKNGGNIWPGRVTAMQQAIYTEMFANKGFTNDVAVVGPALMHNVANIDADYQAIAAAGIQRWCTAGDFHYYPGNAGPILNASEAARARQAYGNLQLWQSETGWTGADTPPDLAGRFSVEALLRNHLTGIVGTLIYELADESQYVAGREGLFGMRTPAAPKAAYLEVANLLTSPDGSQDFPGWLGDYALGVPSDVDAVVTSEGDQQWTVYLLKAQQTRVTLILPPGFSADTGTESSGEGGNIRYLVRLDDTMTVVGVSAPPRSDSRR